MTQIQSLGGWHKYKYNYKEDDTANTNTITTRITKIQIWRTILSPVCNGICSNCSSEKRRRRSRILRQQPGCNTFNFIWTLSRFHFHTFTFTLSLSHFHFHILGSTWVYLGQLSLFQINIEWFRTLKPISGWMDGWMDGWDGMGGYLRLPVC